MKHLSLRKLFSVSAAAALALGVVIAATPAQAAETTIKLWLLTPSESGKAAFDSFETAFEAANPSIKLDISYRSTDEHKNSLRSAAGTTAGPDLYMMWAGLGLGGEFVKSGVSQEITKYYKQYNWSSRFSKVLLSHITQYGGYHGVPWTQRSEAIYYNKALFKKAGITKLPTTYQELIAANNKLVAKGITPMAFGGTVNWHLMRLLDNLIETQCGAKTAESLTSRSANWKTTPCVTKAFTEMKLWTDKYLNKSMMSIDNTGADTLFTTGKSAMQLEGDWFGAGTIASAKLDPKGYGVFAFPTNSPRIYGFAEAVYLNVSSEHKDEAAKVLDFITSEAGQKILSPALGGFSVNKNVKMANPNNLDTDWVKVINAKNGVFVNYDQAFPLAVTTEYWRIQNLVALGNMKPNAAGAAMQSFIEKNK
jgi:raffinose/stachyose/melibiose transport system substrate-binding protein